MANSQQGNRPSFIVAIGSSAGGLSALEQFFDNIPADSGMCFLIIQHLSSDFKSHMDELLSRHTVMPIRQVVDGVALEPDTVYLNASMAHVELRDGLLRSTPVARDLQVRQPIDVFLKSLAEEAGPRGVAVILSGTGRDGSAGIRALHEAGGLVIAQSPESANFSGMPESALATGVCDFIVPTQEMPGVIMKHLAEEPQSTLDGSGGREDESQYLEIYNLLQREYNLDFAKYKIGTVGRRIRRRMGYRRLDEVSQYSQILSSDEQELNDLYHDLLIGVTEFFRDPKAFRHLENEVIPQLFAALTPGDDLRAWSAGCASGEEAYSLAMLLSERGEQVGFTGKISVFATDVHKRSLAAAAQGVFTREALAKLAPERLERFFVEVDKNLFKVKTELRKLVTFAHHDLTRDMPFIRQDLICCRNLLIYLQPEAQKKVLVLFHGALKLNGVLFLGKCEGIGSLTSEFETVSASNKIFRKVRDQRLPMDFDASRKTNTAIVQRQGVQSTAQRSATLDSRTLYDYDVLLDRYLPPGVLVDEKFQVIHCFGDVAQFLKPLKGRLETDILSLTDGNLHIALSTSLQKARKTGQNVATRNVRVNSEGEEYFLDLTVDPIALESSGSLHYHVCFKQIQKEPAPVEESRHQEELECFEPSLYFRQHVADLELELQSTREDLLAAQENLQSTNEALNASNEELQAANEELQSANEELNSANEELQSTNEELYSVNSEYERSNMELKQLNLDLTNLLTSIDNGIIFLDRQMLIRRFNPAISSYFKLLPQDIGRPIDHIAYQLADQEELMGDIGKVLSDGLVIEKEVATREGEWLLSRIMPFKSEEGLREGVVITFTRITRVKEAELKVNRLNEELARRVVELEQTYRRLEEESGERLHALEELRQKDQLMIQQSRMAAMGEMLGNIAHQWRQPLNVLGLQVQELRMAYKVGKFSEELLNSSVEKVMQVLQHMSQTIDDFREFLLLDKEKKPFKVDDVVRKSASLIEASLREHKIAVEIDSIGDPQIYGRPNEYAQVLINVLMNAKDAFCDHERGDARITVRSWNDSGKAVVTITDNAGGIPEEILDQIFEAYFTTKDSGKGTGVGLFMSRNIVESMGGRITARNVEGGAEFRIEV